MNEAARVNASLRKHSAKNERFARVAYPSGPLRSLVRTSYHSSGGKIPSRADRRGGAPQSHLWLQRSPLSVAAGARDAP